MTDQSKRTEREEQLRSALVQLLEDFREKYEPLPRNEVAWSHAVKEWLPLWCAWADREPDGTPPPVPSLDTPMAAAATVDQVIGVRVKPYDEKQWEWRRLWARTRGYIALFEKDEPGTDDERVWIRRVQQDMYSWVDAALRELMLVHRDLRSIDDLDGTEIVDAYLGLGVYADDDDLDDEDDEDVDGPEQLPS